MTTHANQHGTVTMWVVSANTWLVTCFGFLVYLFSFLFYSWDRTEPALVDQFWQSIHHMTCFRARKCLCGSWWGVKSKNSNSGRLNKTFSSLSREIVNLHIIESTASIPTKFCMLIKTTKCPSWVVRTHASQIQDGGRLLSWKYLKIAIYRQRLDRFWPNLAQRCSSTLSSCPTIKNFEIQDGGGCHHEKSKNRHISAAVWSISMKFGTVTDTDPLDRQSDEILKIQVICSCHSERNRNNASFYTSLSLYKNLT